MCMLYYQIGNRAYIFPGGGGGRNGNSNSDETNCLINLEKGDGSVDGIPRAKHVYINVL